MIEVSTEFPTILEHESKIAFIGFAPGKDDEVTGRPFSGFTGNYLSQAINAAGILRSASLMGNICSVQMPGKFTMDSWQVQEGKIRLRKDLTKFKPNLVVLLGDLPLTISGIRETSVNYRGSLFMCVDQSSPFYGFKCLSTVNPATVVKQFDLFPLLCFDMTRAKEEGNHPEFVPTPRHFDLHLTPNEIIRRLEEWPKYLPGAFDIEGGCKSAGFSGITCMSIASSPNYAFIIDWKRLSDEDKPRMWTAVRNWLRDPDIPKIAQNIAYEVFCLAWEHKIPVANLHADTMLSGWEIYPELPKALGVQASIWTREPYYKNERKILDDETHHRYCCKDSAVTYEIAQAHQKYMDEHPTRVSSEHYKLNMDLVPAFAYVEQRGIKYNSEAAKEAILELEVEMNELQMRIELLNGAELNINSPKQMQHALYTRHRYEKQYAKEGNKKTTKLTCDVVALLTLLRKHNTDLIYNILKWRQLEGVRKQLEAEIDKDSRIRCSYTIPGSETGRFACKGSFNGTGYNLQTVTKKLRKLFIADENQYMFQLDLSGADGWTVAAHSARLGDSRMLEDLLAGVKPARTICALYLTKDMAISHMSSADLLDLIKNIKIPEWLYAAAKAVQHGSCYGMGKPTMSSNILKQSWKQSGEPIYVDPKSCGELQELFFKRYTGVLKWQTWVKLQLERTGMLRCASGHIRNFLGRRTDNATLQAAYSHEPQANTTYAVSLAIRELWNDRDNRVSNGRLQIEPLHQVHDALIGQFPRSSTDVSIGKLRKYFNNQLTIAEQQITIPYEGEYGLYWGDNSGGKI